MKKQSKKQQLRKGSILASLPDSGVLHIDSFTPIELTAAEGEGSALPRATMEAYTSVPFRPDGWNRPEPLIVDVAGIQFPTNKRVPLHRDHDPGKVVGHSESITVEAGKLYVAGIMSGHNSHTTEVVGMSGNGFVWQASIGAKIIAEPEFVPAGVRKRVNGRQVEGPVSIARKTRLSEVSFVSLGADGNTTAFAASDNRRETMDPEFVIWLEAKGFSTDTLTDDTQTYLKAQYDAELKAADTSDEGEPGTKGSSQTSVATINATQEVATLRTAVSDFYARQAVYAKEFEGHPELIAAAIKDNWSDETVKAQKELIDLKAKIGNGPGIHVAPAKSDVDSTIVEAAMHRGSDQYNSSEQHFDEQTLDKLDKLQASGHVPYLPKLKYLVCQVHQSHGKLLTAGMPVGESEFQAAGHMSIRGHDGVRVNINAAQGFSTISLPGVLSNLMHKRLSDSYQNVPSVFRAFCRTSSTDDFKVQNKHRILGLGDLEKLGATGEIKHTDLDEDAYQISVETRARMIALTRKMKRNDDLDALMKIPTFMGDAGARTLEKSVMEVLLGNAGNFFNDGATVAGEGHRPNALAAGAGSAFSPAALEAAEQLFLEQQDKLGRPIMVQPNMLLASTKLKRAFDNQLNKSTVVVSDTNNAAGTPSSQLRVANEFSGDFQPITTPWLGAAAGLTGASDTAWYLLSSPAAGALIDVAFLDGRQMPYIESDDTDFNTLGQQFRAYFDWGVAYEDPRFGVYSPGA